MKFIKYKPCTLFVKYNIKMANRQRIYDLPPELRNMIHSNLNPEEMTDTQLANYLSNLKAEELYGSLPGFDLPLFILDKYKERISNLQDHQINQLYRAYPKSGKLSAFLKQILKDRGEALEARCNEAYANEGLNFTVCQKGYDIESDNGNDPESQFRRACFRKNQDATSKFKCLKPASYPTYDSTFFNPKSSERIREFPPLHNYSTLPQWQADRGLNNNDFFWGRPNIREENGQRIYIYPEYLTIIQKEDFEGDNYFEAIEIHEGVVAIGAEAFSVRSTLTSVTFTGNNPQLSVIGKKAFHMCQYLKHIAIPNSVIFIRPKAFSHCQSLQTITLSNKLRTIEREVFEQCENLREIRIPDSVEEIQDSAFHSCKNLGLVTFGKNPKLKTIGVGAFMNTGIPHVIIPASVRKVQLAAFSHCKCYVVTVEGEDTEIEDMAFAGCNIRKVYINAKNKQYQREKDDVNYFTNYNDFTKVHKIYDN